MPSESNSQEYEGGDQENQVKYHYHGMMLRMGEEVASPLRCHSKAVLPVGALNESKEKPMAQTEHAFFTQPVQLRAMNNNNRIGGNLYVRGRSPRALNGNQLQPILHNGQFNKSKTGMRNGISGDLTGNLHQSSNPKNNCPHSWAAPLPAGATVANSYQQQFGIPCGSLGNSAVGQSFGYSRHFQNNHKN